MAKISVLVVFAYGSLLNVLTSAWGAANSTLERRRNDILTLLLWVSYLGLAIWAVAAGASSRQTSDPFELLDWGAILLPFALAGPSLLSSTSSLVQEIEMKDSVSEACMKTLPLAWLHRSLLVGEQDSEGSWLASRRWEKRTNDKSPLSSDCSLWHSTGRESSLGVQLNRGRRLLTAAMRTKSIAAWLAIGRLHIGKAVVSASVTVMCALLLLVMSSCVVLTVFESLVMIVFDFAWWLSHVTNSPVLPRYSSVHLSKKELELIYVANDWLDTPQRDAPISTGVSWDNKPGDAKKAILGAIVTTVAVFENSFRTAYLASPMHSTKLTSQMDCRTQYEALGYDVDRVVRHIRRVLGERHAAGLVSLVSPEKDAGSALHDIIECVLSVSMCFSSCALYNISSVIAKHEYQTEWKIARNHKKGYTRDRVTRERDTRERVIYGHVRNITLWLLRLCISRDWKAGEIPQRNDGVKYSMDYMDSLYVIATFLSRCLHSNRYPLDDESGCYGTVRQICRCITPGLVACTMKGLSMEVMDPQRMPILEWVSRESGVSFSGNRDGLPTKCHWKTNNKNRTAPCVIWIRLDGTETEEAPLSPIYQAARYKPPPGHR